MTAQEPEQTTHKYYDILVLEGHPSALEDLTERLRNDGYTVERFQIPGLNRIMPEREEIDAAQLALRELPARLQTHIYQMYCVGMFASKFVEMLQAKSETTQKYIAFAKTMAKRSYAQIVLNCEDMDEGDYLRGLIEGLRPDMKDIITNFDEELDYEAFDRNILNQLLDNGLDGIEVYYPYDISHRIESTERYRKIAEQHGLLISGGTDFHGDGRTGLSDIKLDLSKAEKIVSLG